MNRRLFLKLTGLIAIGQAVQTVPLVGPAELGGLPTTRAHAIGEPPASSAMSPSINQPGTYRITGLVRLEAPLVEISGIANKQSISWSNTDGAALPVASFVTFEQYDRPVATPRSQVRGGHLEALFAVPLD